MTNEPLKIVDPSTLDHDTAELRPAFPDLAAMSAPSLPYECLIPETRSPIERLLLAVADLTHEVSTFSAHQEARDEIADSVELRHRVKLAVRDLGRATMVLTSLKGGR